MGAPDDTWNRKVAGLLIMFGLFFAAAGLILIGSDESINWSLVFPIFLSVAGFVLVFFGTKTLTGVMAGRSHRR